MSDVTHLSKIEGAVRIVGNAVFESAVGREQHVLWVSYTRTIHDKAILEGLHHKVGQRY